MATRAPDRRLVGQYGTHLWQPQTQMDFSGGIVRDVPRYAIPTNAVYDAADYVISPKGFLYKRGGFGYLRNANTASGGNSSVVASKFTAGDALVTATDGHLWKVNSAGTTDIGNLGTDFATTTSMCFINNGGSSTLFLVICANASTTKPKTYDGSSIADLGGTPPAAYRCCSHLSRLVLARTSAAPGRVYFSPVPDIGSTWDTTNSYIDVPYPITGVLSIGDVLLVFTTNGTWKIIGDTPPPGTNMSLRKVSEEGAFGPQTACVYGGNAIFANSSDVWMTDGVATKSLTQSAGLTSYHRALIATCVGIHASQYLFVGYSNGSALLCYLPTGAWTRVSQISPGTAAPVSLAPSSSGQTAELYGVTVGGSSAGRVMTYSGFFAPTSANKTDADGTAVAPVLETRPFGFFPDTGRFGKAHLTYDMRDAASDNPTMAVTVAPGVEATTYAAASSGTPLAETTDAVRARFSTGKESQALSFKFTQTNASTKTEIYAVAVDTRPNPKGAEGQ